MTRAPGRGYLRRSQHIAKGFLEVLFERFCQDDLNRPRFMVIAITVDATSFGREVAAGRSCTMVTVVDEQIEALRDLWNNKRQVGASLCRDRSALLATALNCCRTSPFRPFVRPRAVCFPGPQPGDDRSLCSDDMEVAHGSHEEREPRRRGAVWLDGTGFPAR